MMIAVIGGVVLVLVVLALAAVATRTSRRPAPSVGATTQRGTAPRGAARERAPRPAPPTRVQGGVSPVAPQARGRSDTPSASRQSPHARATTAPGSAGTTLAASPRAVAPTVLIVDDSAIMRRTLTTLFDKAGYQTACAEDGAAALSWVRGNGMPGLVTLDMEMPGMDGLQTLEALGTIGADRKVQAVFVTSKMQTIGARETAAQRGAIGFFSKPYDPAELLALARRVAPLT